MTFFGIPSSEDLEESSGESYDLEMQHLSSSDYIDSLSMLSTSSDYFDSLSMLSASPDFFDALSTLSDHFFDTEEALSTPPEVAAQPQLEAHSEAAAAEPIPPVERKFIPWLTGVIVVLYATIFIVTMGINNCPKHTYPTKACFPSGRFSFQPTDQNPLFGPSRTTLIKMGGLYMRNVLHMHQIWRLFSSIWLHEGLSQLLTDTVTLIGVAVPLERKYGYARVALLYIISGLGGSLVSALFYQSSVTVGASGALAGLAGGTISKSFIEFWTLHLPMGYDLSVGFATMFINIVVTVVQHGDNFANLGGSIIGLLFGFVLFDRPPVSRLRRTILLIIIFAGLLIGMMLTLKGVNLNDHCPWCHYLDCIPFPGWSCKYRGIDCDSFEIGNSLTMTCKGNEKRRIFPLTNGIPPKSIEELCFRLCHT